MDIEAPWQPLGRHLVFTAKELREAFEQALEAVGARYRSEVYEGARHGYTMADSAAYDEAARDRHFGELRGLLQRTLGS